MSSYLEFSRYIRGNAQSLATEVVEGVIHRMQLDIPKWEEEQGVTMFTELLNFLGESLVDEHKGVVPDALLNWSKKNSEMQVSSGGDIAEIVVRYPPTRDFFHEILTRISVEIGLSVKELSYVLRRINQMLDISLNETVFSFKRLSDKYKEDTQKELLKLSAPIVPIKDNIVIISFIGDIGPNFTLYIFDHVIPKIREMEVSQVIADFSGVLTINVENAEWIHRLWKALHIMGINFIITGLRADLVHNMVNNGIDMKDIDSFATVKQAIRSI